MLCGSTSRLIVLIVWTSYGRKLSHPSTPVFPVLDRITETPQTRPHMDSSAEAQLCEPRVLGLN